MSKRVGWSRSQDEGKARTAFWDWFQENCSLLGSVRTGQEPVYAQLITQIRRVHEGLLCEFSVHSDQEAQMVISAGGDPDVFPAVERLVAVAPDIPGWKITAFRQRRSMDDVNLRIEDTAVKQTDLWYSSEPHANLLGLNIYVRGLKDSNVDVLANAVFLFLDYTLGEYDATTRVKVLELQSLPPSPGEMGLRPLSDLPGEVDSYFR
ncbi:MAG: hypothetical protein IT209_10135 [Armatimonadetes bacterium]|nr:hypothetical protein [Armatimonadota bacterium]